MDNYTVLLNKWAELPHMDLGEEIANITGIHKQTVYTRLRHQDGIIFENLESAKAVKVAEFLSTKGFKALAVPDSDLFPERKYNLVRNADVLTDGLEIEDPYGNKTMIDTEKIVYIHAGWVEENLKDADNRMGLFGTLTGSKHGSVEGPAWKKISTTNHIGWVLHIFCDGENEGAYRIIGSKFYYDYQGEGDVPQIERFAILLKDLTGITRERAIDPEVMSAIKSHPEVLPEMRYATVDDLEGRLRWQMTLRGNQEKLRE